jgi:hypothetical protein
MLGLSSEDDAITVAEGIGTRFLARRSDPHVEGYDWGGLTSGSSLQPLWVLLLPFTVLNVAGWMHPPPNRAFKGQIRSIRFLVRFLGLCMTASFAVWFAVVLVDVLGYQWTRRLAAVDVVRNFEVFGWKAVSTGDVQPIQVVGMVLGGLATSAVLWGINRIADNTQKEFERAPLSRFIPLPIDRDRRRWGASENLASERFFAHAPAAHRWLRYHRAAMLVVAALVAVRAVQQAAGGLPTLALGQGLLVLAALEFLAVLVLAVVSFPAGKRHGTDVVRCGPAIAAVLAFAVAHAFFSGLILWVVKWFNERPSVEGDDGPLAVQGGPELGLTDVWSVLVGLSLVFGLFWLLRQRKRGSAPDVPLRETTVGQPLDGVTEGGRREVAKARGTALAGHRVPHLVKWLALAFFLVSAGFAVHRLDFNGTIDPRDWSFPYDAGGVFWDIAAWLLPAALVAAVLAVRKATTSPTMRRTIGQLWDVLTFWPRRFHPLAVRPYAERAVPEFQARVLEHVRGHDRPVLVSAHSQGSTLAFAALAPLDPDEVLSRVALVTFGSPIGGLYAQMFPAYYGADQIDALKDKLLGGDTRGWRNFYRLTDPIGVPVFNDATRDFNIADPATVARRDEGDEVPARERDRPAWGSLGGHSLYQREPQLKTWVAEVRNHLAQAAMPAGTRRSEPPLASAAPSTSSPTEAPERSS